MNKPKFYMLVGLPGSGKSHIGEELGIKVFSSDNLRKELYGNENDFEHNGEVFNELHKRIKDCLKKGEDCVYDATNIKSKRRTDFLLNQLRNIECEKICILVLTDINICLKRNAERDRNVPKEVIDRMYRTIDLPQYREGWDKIIIKPTADKENDYNIYQYMNFLKTISHDNPHHLLSVGDHIIASTKYLIENYSLKFAGDIERLDDLTMAMFFHDIGKDYCKTFVNANGETTEIAHYYGHENVSAYMFLLYNEYGFKDKNLDSKMSEIDNKVLYVADLISLHMKLHNIGEKGLDKLKNLIGDRELEDLYIINEADKACS